jgi:hypothetical protein
MYFTLGLLRVKSPHFQLQAAAAHISGILMEKSI